MSRPLTVIKDSVHGTITIPRCITSCIDTVLFQRLRCIKQMGGKYFVYPGASHNRFEHSIGVCHIAGEFVKTLRTNQPELNITDEDVLCVMLAGLFHDIGHGPFSHVFDSMVVPLLDPNTPWKHEDASILLFDFLLDSPKLDGTTVRQILAQENLKDRDFLFIKELILGCPVGHQHRSTNPTEYQFKGRDKDKWFLYEIVSNKYTSIDVDKWDYCARDCHGLRLSYDFDWKRYINGCLVLYDDTLNRKTICPRDKEVINLYDMFHAREMLHRKALQDVTCVSIELMIADALVSACAILKDMDIDIRSSLLIPTEESISKEDLAVAMTTYSQLTDGILSTVTLMKGTSSNTVSNILKRISERQLYRCVGHVRPCAGDEVSLSKYYQSQWTTSAEGIAGNLRTLLKEKDYTNNHYAIYVAKFDYCMQDKDPLALLRTYKKCTREATSLTQEMKSKMLPRSFEEKQVRLYCKDKDKFEELKSVFTEWIEDNGLQQPSVVDPPSTPS